MKRRLIFLYRYFTTSRRWRRWVNAQTVILLVVALAFAATLWLTAPLSTAFQTPAPVVKTTPTPAITSVGPTHTPIPPDYLVTNPQSLGISVGAALLALIVVVGLLLFLPRKAD
jgi:hypothetical protein